jgi:hypothetical protein
MSLIYLASPYSNYPGGKEEAFKLVCLKAGFLMSNGYNVFCPIAHSHPIEMAGNITDTSHEFWLKQDFAVLRKCTEIWVYMLPGWKESFGIGKELDFATEHNIPITYLRHEPLFK